MQTAITEQSINPANIKEKDPSAMAYLLTEKITPNKEIMLMRSDVAIGCNWYGIISW
ncbi:MAG TPA: hypothetical protein VFI70_13040 [Nitrososphaeraceae archaeon]|nr:hypothetical protein [Nitrososphaeraceae archaeon]